MSTLSRRQALQPLARIAGAASIAEFAAAPPSKVLLPADADAYAFAAAAPRAFTLQPQARRADLPTGQENAAIFRLGRAFLTQFFAPALSVSIVRDSKFV